MRVRFGASIAAACLLLSGNAAGEKKGQSVPNVTRPSIAKASVVRKWISCRVANESGPTVGYTRGRGL